MLTNYFEWCIFGINMEAFMKKFISGFIMVFSVCFIACENPNNKGTEASTFIEKYEIDAQIYDNNLVPFTGNDTIRLYYKPMGTGIENLQIISNNIGSVANGKLTLNLREIEESKLTVTGTDISGLGVTPDPLDIKCLWDLFFVLYNGENLIEQLHLINGNDSERVEYYYINKPTRIYGRFAENHPVHDGILELDLITGWNRVHLRRTNNINYVKTDLSGLPSDIKWTLIHYD
jgi:hypothetical protein